MDPIYLEVGTAKLLYGMPVNQLDFAFSRWCLHNGLFFITRLVQSALSMKPPSTIPAVVPSAASRASTAAPQTLHNGSSDTLLILQGSIAQLLHAEHFFPLSGIAQPWKTRRGSAEILAAIWSSETLPFRAGFMA
jgi:hypothetical protein